MLQYILTGLAGIALGVAGMRIWMMERAGPSPGGESETPPDANDRSITLPKLSTRNMLIGAAVLAVAAIGVMMLRSPEGDAPVTGRTSTSSANAGLEDVDTMIVRLAKRLEANPDDGDGFRMLGWSYTMTGQPQKAIEPYKRALELLPDQANVHAGYGEALVGIAGDKVTPEAKRSFEKAISLDPSEPRARYFLALWKAQNGQERAALDEWIALANEGSADAPWQTDIRSRVSQLSQKVGIDVPAKFKGETPVASAGQPPALDASVVEAANQLPDAQRQSMIDGMVEGLAAKLKSNPRDADGWVRLMRSRMVLKQADQAGKDLVTARKALANDLSGLTKVDTAARKFGVPGA